MEIIFNDGDVNVDDIAIFQQFAVVRDPVAHHFINRDADRFWKTVVAQASGNGFLFINDIIVADTVQFAGADARFYVGFDHFQHFSGQAAGNAHFSMSSDVLIEIAMDCVQQCRFFDNNRLCLNNVNSPGVLLPN